MPTIRKTEGVEYYEAGWLMQQVEGVTLEDARNLKAGAVLTVEDSIADALIEQGLAAPYDPPADLETEDEED